MTTTSYSQSSTYISCPKHWYHKYIDKLDSPTQSANLAFGSAFDAATSDLLYGKDYYLKTFNGKWYSTVGWKKEHIPIFDSPTITYSNSDFDQDILTDENKSQIMTWVKDLNLLNLGSDPVEVFQQIAKAKKNPYKKIGENAQKFYNRTCWLSLKRKGELLLEALKEEFIPQVEEVIAVQKHSYLKDEGTGDAITGYIDFVLKMKGRDKPTIFDLKTASAAYKDENIELSDQLTLYAAIDSEKFGTTEVGYVVAVKNFKKQQDGICSVCSHKKEGTHKKCNNVINKKRCNGEWNIVTKAIPEIQIMYADKSEKQMKEALQDQSNILDAMNNKIVYKNTSKCNNWFGQKCMYYDLCHNNDSSGLKKR